MTTDRTTTEPQVVVPAGRFSIAGLLCSMGAAGLADVLIAVAFSWWLYVVTDSAWALAALGIIRTACYAAGAPVGGMLADHYPRRSLMATNLLARAAVTAAMGLLAWFAVLRPEVVVGIGALLAAKQSFFTPLVDALIPQLAGKESLTRVNSGVQAIQALAGIGGPVAGGLLIAAVGLPGVAVLAGGVYLLSATTALRLPSTPYRQAGPAGAVSAQVKHRVMEVARYLKGESLVSLLVGFTVLLNLLVMPVFIVLPVLTRDVLRLTAAHYGGLHAGIPVGMLVGTVITGTIRLRGRKTVRAMASIVWTGLAYASLAAVRSYPGAFLAVVAMGFGMAIASVTGRVILHELVPQDRLGRVFGLMNGLSAAGQAVGYALAGWLMAGWGPGAVVMPLGVLTAAAACVVLIAPIARRV